MSRAALCACLALVLCCSQVRAATPISKRSSCDVFAVDMTFLGTMGLVTDRNRALLVLTCSKAATGFTGNTVSQCLNVTGPSAATFSNIGFADSKQTSFQTFLSWERDYLGDVSVAMACPLRDGQGTQLTMPRAPLRFEVVPNAAVLATARRMPDGSLAHAPAPGFL